MIKVTLTDCVVLKKRHWWWLLLNQFHCTRSNGWTHSQMGQKVEQGVRQDENIGECPVAWLVCCYFVKKLLFDEPGIFFNKWVEVEEEGLFARIQTNKTIRGEN